MSRERHLKYTRVCLVAVFSLAGGLWGAAPAAEPGDKTAVQVIAPLSTKVAAQEVRAVLATLNDAIHTGNYSVLRDLAASGFQEKNTVEDLSLIFQPLRESGASVAVADGMMPEFDAASPVDGDGALILKGRFKTRPREIHFDMSFADQDNRWKLTGLKVTAPEAPRSAFMKSVPSQTGTATGSIQGADRHIRTIPNSSMTNLPETNPTVPVAHQYPEVSQTGPEEEGMTRNDWGVGLGPSVNALQAK